MPIELKNISYIYGAKTPFEKKALDNVSVTIEDNMITGLMGHTGSGKSTLAQLLNGLLAPSEGKIYLNGKDIRESKKSIVETRYKVGLVFQYPEYQLFEETVYKDIAYGPKNMKCSDEEIDTKVREAAEFVGISSDILEKSPFDLSGGQKRRVAIAGIIAMSPDFLVLDEPAAGLDPRGREDILSKIKKYQREKKTSVVIISHSMEDMAKYCDKILVMNNARVFKYGTCDEIFKNPRELSEVGLDVPQITKLINRLKEDGAPITQSVYTVEYAKNEILKLLKKI